MRIRSSKKNTCGEWRGSWIINMDQPQNNTIWILKKKKEERKKWNEMKKNGKRNSRLSG